MKLFYTVLLALLFNLPVNATTWPVSVSNNQFSPATVNAVVGDIIQFNWIQSFHTTTCGPALPGTSLPPGASPWDATISAGATTFSYTVSVEGTYNYGCTPHFEFGMIGTIIVSGTLPARFGSFSVISDKNTALLKWETFSESNTKYFSIRKSTDGLNFKEIGTIAAAGNSSLKVAYQFADNDLGGIYKYLYYEIVTVDIDKKETFSTIKTFRNNSNKNDNLILALSPIPITRPGQVQIQFNADKAGVMEVSIFTTAGQLVHRSKLAAFYGVNSGHLHVCDLDRGIYNIVFMLAGKKEVRKVMVL
ncbi:MAG: plastocyanin/azurin family copper-binding protein [Ferruginibacter sp.]